MFDLHRELCVEVDRAMQAGGEGRAILDPAATVKACCARQEAVLGPTGVELSRLALAARVMRHVLVTSLRGRPQDPNPIHIQTPSDLSSSLPAVVELRRLNRALVGLAGRNRRVSRVAELRLFGGLSCREVSQVFGGASGRRARSDWKLAEDYLVPALRDVLLGTTQPA